MAEQTPSTDLIHPARFSMERCLDRSFALLVRNLVPFLLIAGAMNIPIFLNFLMGSIGTYSFRRMEGPLLIQVLGGFCVPLIVLGTLQSIRGRPVLDKNAVRLAVRRFVPATVLGIVCSALITIGMYLLLVPGAIAATTLIVAMPVCVMERRGVLASMVRSESLTEGYRWRIFGGLIVYWLIVFGVVAAALLIKYLFSLPNPFDVSFSSFPVLLAIFIFGAIMTAYYIVLSAIIYHDLRAVKEPGELDSLLNAFK